MALVIRCRRYVRMLARWFFIVLAALMTGSNCECVAQKYQGLKNLRAQPS